MMIRILLLACILSTISCATNTSLPDVVEPAARLAYPYEHSESCRGCHDHILDQFRNSEHAKAFSNPLFQAQYFKEVVPRAESDPAFRNEAKRCIYCHAPVVYMNFTGMIRRPEQVGNLETGVSCDFCHTLLGYEANGDYRQNPSRKKQGPLKIDNFHAEYSGWVEMSEFCGPCHNASNHRGVAVKATFSEWSESSYAKAKVSCQDCHMSMDGFLKGGKGQYQQGAAAYLNIMFSDKNQVRSDYGKLYSHNFPGAHSNTQVEGAIRLEIDDDGHLIGKDGGAHFRSIRIKINNERSGHKMPSGSSDIRYMWLDVTAKGANDVMLPVTLKGLRAGETNYGVFGANKEDSHILGSGMTRGTRLYRSVYLDAHEKQVLSFIDAAEEVFDNRLKSGEVLEENYLISVPAGQGGPIVVSAVLKYRSAPVAFTRRLGLPDVDPVNVATTTRTISVVPGK